MLLPTPIEPQADTASSALVPRLSPRATAELLKSWRQLQARVDLAERVLAHCDRETVITGKRLW